MFLAAIALVCCLTAFPDSSPVPKQPTTPAVASSEDTPLVKSDPLQPALPNSPMAKIIAVTSSPADAATPASSESILPASQPFSNAPVRPAVQGSYETARQRKI